MPCMTKSRSKRRARLWMGFTILSLLLLLPAALIAWSYEQPRALNLADCFVTFGYLRGYPHGNGGWDPVIRRLIVDVPGGIYLVMVQ